MNESDEEKSIKSSESDVGENAYEKDDFLVDDNEVSSGNDSEVLSDDEGEGKRKKKMKLTEDDYQIAEEGGLRRKKKKLKREFKDKNENKSKNKGDLGNKLFRGSE